MIKKVLAYFLLKLGCKNVSVMLYGVKHLNFKILLDGIFFGKYCVIFLGGITKEFAEKYKKYLLNEKFFNNLIKGLDKKSIDTVKQIEKNLNIILNSKSDVVCLKKSDLGIKYDDYYLNKYIKRYTKDIYLPIDHREASVFYFKHGIKEVEDLDKINGKDILDCGAFIGDSAMMFEKEFNFTDKGGSIFGIEPMPENRVLFEKTIEGNSKKGKIIPIPLGVGAKKGKFYMNFNGSASCISGEDSSNIEIVVDTIDNIVESYNINPGLIKRDIEGLEYDSIIGAERTIKKYKPILLVSIYHTGRDFYEIKPLLESWNLGYRFKIRHLSTHPFFETMLICY